MADYTISVRLQTIDNASQAIANMNQQLQGMGEKRKNSDPTPESKSAWEQYSSAIGMATTALGIYAAAGQALEVVDQGENVNAVRMAFEALSGSTAQAASDMDVLRAATSGVITDFDLMSSANRMRSMGLAGSTEELAELIGMAQQLGSVMSPGSSAAQNIDNFTLMLANNSRLRLDSFGISSDAVKVRMDELKEAGYSVNEAFRMATLEEGRVSLQNLGEAATAGATNVDRLSTSLANIGNTLAQEAARWTNAALDTVNMLGQMGAAYNQYVSDGGLFGQWNREAEAMDRVNEAYMRWREENGGGTFEQFQSSNEYVSATTAQGFGTDREIGDASARSRVQAEREAIQAQMEYEAALIASKEEQLALLTATDEWGQRVMVGAGWMNEAHVAAANMRNAMVSSLGEMDFAVFDGAGLSEDLIGARAESAARIFNEAWIEASTAMSTGDMMNTTTYSGIATGRGDIGGQLLFTAEEAAAAQEVASYYENLVSDAQQLHEQGLINDAELANVQATADAASALADNAQRGAEAFANMNLSQMLGQESGGRAGEITGDVVGFMQQSGQYSASQIAQYQQQLELGTGQQTQTSINYDEVIVPMIADIIARYGADAGVAAIANMNAGMTTAVMSGMTDEQIAAAQAGMTGYGYMSVGTLGQGSGAGGASTSDDKTMGGLTVGAVEDFDIDSFMQSTIQINQDWATIDSSTKSFSDNLTAAGATVDTMLAQVSTVRTQFASLNGMRARMTADIAINITNRGMLEDMIIQIMNDRGGTMPGSRAAPGNAGGER